MIEEIVDGRALGQGLPKQHGLTSLAGTEEEARPVGRGLDEVETNVDYEVKIGLTPTGSCASVEWVLCIVSTG